MSTERPDIHVLREVHLRYSVIPTAIPTQTRGSQSATARRSHASILSARTCNIGAAFLTTVLSTWSYADEEPLRWVIRRQRILGRVLDDEKEVRRGER